MVYLGVGALDATQVVKSLVYGQWRYLIHVMVTALGAKKGDSMRQMLSFSLECFRWSTTSLTASQDISMGLLWIKFLGIPDRRLCYSHDLR